MPVLETTYGGVAAITLTKEDYQATLLPGRGGNLVSFRDVVKGYRFIREPEGDMSTFAKSPMRFGLPILFPPNRYQDGEFTVAGDVYRLPITEESTHNHMHGLFHSSHWPVVAQGDDGEQAYVEIRQDVDEAHPAYALWQHPFSISVRYELATTGLWQRVQVVNRGDRPMPCMLGFHTALNVPFAKDSDRDDYIFTATIGERWQLNERKLPTGDFQPLGEGEQKIAREGISPFFEPMDNHYTARPVDGKNQMVLMDRRLNVKLVYEVGEQYRHWMIWNDGARGRFFCPEPQTNVVNAPNLPLPPSVTGLIVLDPNGVFEETCRFYVESAR